MSTLQPYLHDLVCILSAPVQAWFQQDGSVENTGAQGFYLADERIVSGYALTSTTHLLEPVSMEYVSANQAKFTTIIRQDGMHVDPQLLLTRVRTANADAISETLHLRNATDGDITLNLKLTITADGSSMETVKQGLPADAPSNISATGWSWREGARAEFSASPASESTTPMTLDWNITIAAKSEWNAEWSIKPTVSDAIVDAPKSRFLKDSAAELLAQFEADPTTHRALSAALDDLDALLLARTADPDNTFIAAGAPWFFTLFGRDSLITARFLLDIAPELAAGTLRTLATLQGTKVDAQTAEHPGKIPHELRREALHVKTGAEEVLISPVYYGTIDATCLWIMLLFELWEKGGYDAVVEELLPNLKAALGWIRDYADADDDGFLEYFDETGTGLANQGWKDSGDSIRWSDGTLADGPIALCEVQAYAYEALLDGAKLLATFDPAAAGEWEPMAAHLKERFAESFWVERGGYRYPAIALDVNKKPVDALSSNIGHILGSGLVDDVESDAIVDALMNSEMLSGFGLRTMPTTNGDYWPLRYHVGTVWPHDTAFTVIGLARAGYRAEAQQVARQILDAAIAFDYRLPELFGGWSREEFATPVAYPAACRPQAWAAAAVVVAAVVLAD